MKITIDNASLLGYGFAGILIGMIIFGLHFFYAAAPASDSLHDISGRLLNVKIEHDKSRTFAELVIATNQKNVIIFQEDMKQLIPLFEKLRIDENVTASIVEKQYTDQATGLPRYSMWQLTVGSSTIFTYDELIRIRNKRLKFEYGFGIFSTTLGVLCFFIWFARKFTGGRAKN